MIIESRRQTMRHVPENPQNGIDWLFDRINLGQMNLLHHVDTQNQLAGILTEGNVHSWWMEPISPVAQHDGRFPFPSQPFQLSNWRLHSHVQRSKLPGKEDGEETICGNKKKIAKIIALTPARSCPQHSSSYVLISTGLGRTWCDLFWWESTELGWTCGELLALKHIAGSKANYVLKTRLSGTTYVKILMYLKRVLANFLSMKRDNGSTRMEINPSVFFETQMLNRCRKCSFTTTPNQVWNLQKEDLYGVRDRKSVEVVYPFFQTTGRMEPYSSSDGAGICREPSPSLPWPPTTKWKIHACTTARYLPRSFFTLFLENTMPAHTNLPAWLIRNLRSTHWVSLSRNQSSLRLDAPNLTHLPCPSCNTPRHKFHLLPLPIQSSPP